MLDFNSLDIRGKDTRKMTKNQAKPITPDSHWENVYQSQAQEKARRFRFSKWSYANLAELAGHLGSLSQSRSTSFLEVGCAPCRFMIYFSQVFGWDVAGIELSEMGLTQSKKLLQVNGVRARLYAGDVLEIEPDCHYDVVGSFGLVEHFDDPLPCYHAMARWIRPGGAMIVTVPNLVGLIGRAMRFRNYKHYLEHQRFSPEDLADHCRAVGLRVTFYGLVGNLWIPPVYDALNSTRFQRLANLPPRLTNYLVRRAAAIVRRPIKLGSLTFSAGCVAWKDK